MLIAFEGLPGAGKTTQARRLAAYLVRRGTAVTYLPDNLTRTADPLGQTLLALFNSGDPFARQGSVITETFLAAAIRANTLPTHITPALDAGTTVIEDRGLHTMYSYSLATILQKHHTHPGPAIAWLKAVGTLAGRAADHSFWLHLPADQAIARAERRQGHPYTGEQHAFLHRVHEAYAALAAIDPSLHVVDITSLDIEQAHDAVLAALTNPAGTASGRLTAA